ncbi:Holliday junction branch migration protein RuvA [Ancylomarina euxinus]|uniref:Holliday junction branch migration complex subunit RuvA n=1 Tax=Ancylomarina euxinus TaxID=2283627 RepID=A0A425XYU6_9BACT|nr:Holliday junction branch migration protein RuvA [Ancylomarina euxinus]MCZ4695640.1 Holliday junction branch migration protein RuvA [Ancylomarina euxinus]MUP16056.1 Holliday junction branch migration protein RuvA [Ancylomarina euxinus]RRG20300.1 Holliday junction branch migration protein RuvA [Ancylomarina euxinus]
MFEYIKGDINALTPTAVILENHGMGYFINITLNTYSQLSGHTSAQLYLHQVIRDDAHLLFGFKDMKEREVFRLLISVSGVGANTARMMLSSLTSEEVKKAIFSNNSKTLQDVKGIGTKTAQRIIIELKDKIGKEDEMGEIVLSQDNTIREEALSALVMLGFAKNTITKVLDKIIKANAPTSVEELIKIALKQL